MQVATPRSRTICAGSAQRWPPLRGPLRDPAGQHAQVDFARFIVTFADEPGVMRIVWLFWMVLGHSRHIWARFVLHQDLQTVLRCHIAAFADLGCVPGEILYSVPDRTRRVVEVHQFADEIQIFDACRLVAAHAVI